MFSVGVSRIETVDPVKQSRFSVNTKMEGFKSESWFKCLRNTFQDSDLHTCISAIEFYSHLHVQHGSFMLKFETHPILTWKLIKGS